jgi:hypothetical protein
MKRGTEHFAFNISETQPLGTGDALSGWAPLGQVDIQEVVGI